jgi:hypothetical protein
MCNVMRSEDVTTVPDARSNDGSFPSADLLAWGQQRWRWLLVVLVVLFGLWRFSGKQPDPVGRFVLVKDDVPCQMQREDEDGRRWCYLVLDTRSGRLEERVRKVGPQKKK